MPFARYFCIFINVGLGELSLAGTASGVIGLNGYVTIPLIISGSRRTLIIQWGHLKWGKRVLPLRQTSGQSGQYALHSSMC